MKWRVKLSDGTEQVVEADEYTRGHYGSDDAMIVFRKGLPSVVAEFNRDNVISILAEED